MEGLDAEDVPWDRTDDDDVCVCREELNIKSVQGTLAVFLQNDAGFVKWEPTPERISELVLAFQLPEQLRK